MLCRLFFVIAAFNLDATVFRVTPRFFAQHTRARRWRLN